MSGGIANSVGSREGCACGIQQGRADKVWREYRSGRQDVQHRLVVCVVGLMVAVCVRVCVCVLLGLLVAVVVVVVLLLSVQDVEHLSQKPR